MKTYTIASVEGVGRFGVPASPDDKALKVGDNVSLDLTDDQERAVFAAGWLATPTNKKKEA